MNATERRTRRRFAEERAEEILSGNPEFWTPSGWLDVEGLAVAVRGAKVLHRELSQRTLFMRVSRRDGEQFIIVDSKSSMRVRRFGIAAAIGAPLFSPMVGGVCMITSGDLPDHPSVLETCIFAAALLMPEPRLARAWADCDGDPDSALSRVASVFRVTKPVAAWRLARCGVWAGVPW